MEKSSHFQVQAFGHYVLLDRVAVGGMAEIFKAKQSGARGFEKIVVIKKILHHLSEDPEFVEMFEDEAKIAAQLNHANIVQIFELGEVNDTLYIAMELVEGRNLRDVTRAIASKGMHMSIEQSIFVIQSALKGLDYAHRKKNIEGEELEIIHRDISPQNVILSYEGEVKILDFGIAKASSKISQTEAGVLKGKFSYMSPEQASGREIDQSTDVYALGVIFHELLTSQRLFKADTDIETLERVRIGNVAAPSEKNPNVPPDLDRIVLKALARNPAKRFSSAGEMLAELNRFNFEQGLSYASQDLSAFMRALFRESIQAERERLQEALAQVPHLDAKDGGKTQITFKAKTSSEYSSSKAAVEVSQTEHTVTGYRPSKATSIVRQSLLGLLFFSALAWVILLSVRNETVIPTEPSPQQETTQRQTPLPESPTTPSEEETEDKSVKEALETSPSVKELFSDIKIDVPENEAEQDQGLDPDLAEISEGRVRVIPPLGKVADFFINGELIGTAPGLNAVNYPLPVGEHKLRCRMRDDPTVIYEQVFQVEADALTDLFCEKGDILEP